MLSWDSRSRSSTQTLISLLRFGSTHQQTFEQTSWDKHTTMRRYKDNKKSQSEMTKQQRLQLSLWQIFDTCYGKRRHRYLKEFVRRSHLECWRWYLSNRLHLSSVPLSMQFKVEWRRVKYLPFHIQYQEESFERDENWLAVTLVFGYLCIVHSHYLLTVLFCTFGNNNKKKHHVKSGKRDIEVLSKQNQSKPNCRSVVVDA